MAHSLRINPAWVQFGGYDSEEAMTAMNTILDLDDLPTAAIVDDLHLPAVFKSLEQHGYTPGEDFSVVGTNNQGISKAVYPTATSVDMCQQAAAQQAMEALEKVIVDRSYRETIFIQPELICRNSTNQYGAHRDEKAS